MKRIERSRSATRARALSAGPSIHSWAGQERSGLNRVLLLLAAIAAAFVTALSLGSPSADAAFPAATNGKIACGGLRTADADLEIFDVNPDGTGERLFTSNGFRDTSPSYSPDGTKIAFESGRDRILGQGDNTEIYVGNNDGNLTGPDVKRLTFNRGVLQNGTLSANAATDFSPSWSPDGTEIAFHSGREVAFTDGLTPNPTSDFEIYKMSATTGESVNPATRLTFNRGQDAVPSWSPDGTKIAFQGFPPGNPATLNNNLEIWTINPDGSGRTNLTNSPGTPNNPATLVNENTDGLDRDVIWSTDSRQLAFNSARAGITGNQNNDVWRMNRDGTSPVRLTTGADSPSPAPFTDYDVPLVWSPDNRELLIASSRDSTFENTDFFAYRIDPTVVDGPATRVARVEQFQRCDWTKPQPARVVPPPVVPPRVVPPVPVPIPPFASCPTASQNVIRGTGAANRITGTARGDRIFANAGNDVVNALAGNDCVDLGAGVDTGQGGAGNDLMRGQSGADRISGGSGNDSLTGGSGADRITGGSGADRISGGSGNDRISARDRKRDRVNCGSGRRDSVTADRIDIVSRNCERVRRR